AHQEIRLFLDYKLDQLVSSDEISAKEKDNFSLLFSLVVERMTIPDKLSLLKELPQEINSIQQFFIDQGGQDRTSLKYNALLTYYLSHGLKLPQKEFLSNFNEEIAMILQPLSQTALFFKGVYLYDLFLKSSFSKKIPLLIRQYLIFDRVRDYSLNAVLMVKVNNIWLQLLKRYQYFYLRPLFVSGQKHYGLFLETSKFPTFKLFLQEFLFSFFINYNQARLKK
ncbi:hypothetical protein ACFLQ1_00625, partial [Candidatus Auribacterota bacterium]